VIYRRIGGTLRCLLNGRVGSHPKRDQKEPTEGGNWLFLIDISAELIVREAFLIRFIKVFPERIRHSRAGRPRTDALLVI